MTAAFKIARRELRSLFYSPIAWVLLIVFVIQVSTLYIENLSRVLHVMFAGYERPVTFLIFSMPKHGLFANVVNALMFYVPLLTMGLISRERQNGSIRLLMSSPVTLVQMVLGKYLAMLVYLLLFVVFLLLLMVSTGVMAEQLDYPRVLSGILGIYLLAATYAAVGLFMSSLTNHQMVAAIGTIALLASLSFIGSVGQRVPVVEEVAYWLSIEGRTEYLLTGLIASKDVLYFLSIVTLFLVFTFLKLAAGRRPEGITMHAVRYSAVFGIVVLFGYVTSLPSLTVYADTTQNQQMTLTPASIEALEGFEGTLDMTVLVNALELDARQFLPARRKRMYRRVFEDHERELGRINVQYRYYYAESDNERLHAANPGKSDAELAREYAEQQRMDFGEFLSLADVHESYGLERQQNDNVYLLEWQGQTSVLGNFRDINYFPEEAEVSAAVKRLIAGPRTIAYVTGHGERRAFRRGSADHRAIITREVERDALVNHGFDVIELALNRRVPEVVDILVLAAPVEPLSETALTHLRAYIAAGRDLLILGEPGSQDTMNEIVADLGITFPAGSFREAREGFPEDMVFAALTSHAVGMGFAQPEQLENYPVVLPGVGPLHHDEGGSFAVKPLLTAMEGRAKLAVALERSVSDRDQRIVVVGDADFMSAATLGLPEPGKSKSNNEAFLHQLFSYLSHEEYPIDTLRPPPLDTRIAIDLKQVDYLKLVLHGVIPGALLLGGGGLLLHRRRR